MNLQTLMATYPESEKFKEKFPLLWDYAAKVEVIEWQDDFAVADRNPEKIDELDFFYMLLQNGMISEDEYMEKTRSISYASKTVGIAFMDEDKVSFRSKRPKFYVLVHELGHCYFKAPDPIWSSDYGGGEDVLWLIYKDLLEGNENTIKAWIDLMELAHEDREKVMAFLDDFALRLAEKYDIDLDKIENWGIEGEERPIVKLMRFGGTLTFLDRMPKDFLFNLIDGVLYQDPHYATFAEEFFQELHNIENLKNK